MDIPSYKLSERQLEELKPNVRSLDVLERYLTMSEVHKSAILIPVIFPVNQIMFIQLGYEDEGRIRLVHYNNIMHNMKGKPLFVFDEATFQHFKAILQLTKSPVSALLGVYTQFANKD